MQASSAIQRVAVVTGANKGVGYYIALQLASCGKFTNVILACRDDTRGQMALTKMRQELSLSNPHVNCQLDYLPLSIGDTHSHTAFSQRVLSDYEKVDVLVNNAAIAFKGADPTPFNQQCTPTLNINFRGTLDFTQQLLPLLRKGRDARIVNVASMAGRLSQLTSSQLIDQFTSPHLTKEGLVNLINQFESDVHSGCHASKGWSNSNYGMSKLAVIALTKVLAREELGNGIKVNCCCPGYCDTDMTSHRGTRSPMDGARNAVLPAIMEDCPTGEFFRDLQVARW